MHNLFGDTHSINIELDDNGYHFYDLQKGEHVSDLLDYVHINSEDLKAAYGKNWRKAISASSSGRNMSRS